VKEGFRNGGAGVEEAMKELVGWTDSNPPNVLVNLTLSAFMLWSILFWPCCGLNWGNGVLGSVGPSVCHSQSIGLSCDRF
jgi:hypothetical protein